MQGTMRQSVRSCASLVSRRTLAVHLFGDELVEGFHVDGRTCWRSSTAQQVVDGLPQLPRVRVISFDLVSPEIYSCGAAVDGRDAVDCTMPS